MQGWYTNEQVFLFLNIGPANIKITCACFNKYKSIVLIQAKPRFFINNKKMLLQFT